MRLIYIVIGLAIIAGIFVVSGGLDSLTSSEKIHLYCTSQNQTCMAESEMMLRNCTEAVITEDLSEITTTYEIRNDKTNCQIYFTVIRSSIPHFKGTSMNCEVPLSEMNLFIQKDRKFKYCEGTLKEEYFNQMYRLVGMISR